MSTSYIFDNKRVKLPGAYAATKADITPSANVADYSKVLIIDTGSNANWGSGSGVLGEFTEKTDSLFKFRSSSDLRNFVKGGPLYNLGSALFEPSNIRGTAGASEVFFISAKETKAPRINLTVKSGKIEFIVKEEGTFGNGVIVDGKLSKGYSLSIVPGRRFPNKFIVTFEIGTFTGLAADNIAYNEVEEKDAKPEMITASPEISTWEEFFNWAKYDNLFKLGFDIASTPITGNIDITDITNIPVLAAGGTETYTPKALDEVMSVCKKTKAYFILSDRQFVDATTLKLQYWTANQTKYPTVLIVPGGDNYTEFEKTQEDAKTLNSDGAWIIYNGIKLLSNTGQLREFNSLIHAGYIVGRIAGVAPQVPATFKEINIAGLSSNPSEFDLEDCLDDGILTSYYDDDLERFCILKGVNTLQNNRDIVNADGSTHSIQCRRIADYVNTEMIVDAKLELFSQREGVTMTSLSEAFVADWIKLKLRQKVDRNLIFKFLPESIRVVREQDAYHINYKFSPNYEINFLFMTGFMIN